MNLFPVSGAIYRLYATGYANEVCMIDIRKKITFPRPSPDLKAYKETVAKGFEEYPLRHKNYIKYKKAVRNSSVDYMPVKLDIENVSRCNLRCRICQIGSYPGQKRAEDLSYEDFVDILDRQTGVFEIKLQGIGEPFLGKDFIAMVKYASSKKIWVRTATNATLLDVNDNYKKIIDAGVGEIQISIDGANKTTFEKIRVNARFERVAENCKLINDYCDKTGSDKTRMWVVLQRDNINELHQFPALAKRLGFKRLTLSMDINSWGSEEKARENSVRSMSGRMEQADIDLLLKEASSLGISLSFWDITMKYSSGNPCPWPFERSYISSDKKVVPCCMIGNPDIYNLGSLGDFAGIWASPQYEEFRKKHMDGNVPDICKYCYQSAQARS